LELFSRDAADCDAADWSQTAFAPRQARRPEALEGRDTQFALRRATPREQIWRRRHVEHV